MRAKKQNRASQGVGTRSHTLSQSSSLEPHQQFHSPAHPGAVLPPRGLAFTLIELLV